MAAFLRRVGAAAQGGRGSGSVPAPVRLRPEAARNRSSRGAETTLRHLTYRPAAYANNSPFGEAGSPSALRREIFILQIPQEPSADPNPAGSPLEIRRLRLGGPL